MAAAGLDVAQIEPLPATSPLLSAKNCYLTPHIAWALRETRERLLGIVIANLKAFLKGKKLNVVN